MDHPFRSAALGGFNRQDVLDYLEKMSAENSQRQQELQHKLEALEEERQKLSAKMEEQERLVASLRRERESLNQELDQVKQALTVSLDREETQRGELIALRQERDELIAKVEVLEPDAAAYAAVKERTAGVELEAHRRAQSVLNQANDQAQELRRSMEQWMGRVEREYDSLRSQVEATVSHAADKLEKAENCLEQMTALLADQDVALEALAQAYDSTDPGKGARPCASTGGLKLKGSR